MEKKLTLKINIGILLLGILISLFFNAFPFKKLYSAPKYVNKIALGACITQEKKQPIWKSILKERSDIFIFMGDNVYGDDRVTGKLDKLSKAYKKQKTKIPFTKLEATNEVYAIWDDHDYGKNDGGADLSILKRS
jgi:Predicted phosphohydrolases